MRVAYLAAGAGGMYCGSCLRDNRLAATLLAQGHDVVLVPVYTPLRTDEPDVSLSRVYYGGINVYLQQKWSLFRHTPWVLDRLLDSRRLLQGVTRLAAGTSPQELGALTVSVLKGAEGAQAKELAKLIRGLRKLAPDLINLPNLMFAALAQPLKEALGTPVVCTLTGEDIFLDKLPEPFKSQARDLIRLRSRDVDGFIAFTRYYASHAAEHFGLPAERLHVVPLGVGPDILAEPSPPPAEPFTIGYLARICPDKGLHVLAQAFRVLRGQGRDCRLAAAGYLPPGERPYLEAIRGRLAEDGLADGFECLGEVNLAGKRRFLALLHVLSVPTVYREAKGLYVLEALANGVPVVQPRHGSFPELIEATGGGLLFEPGDPRELAAALARLMDDPALREELGNRGRSAVLQSFTAEMMARKTWAVYQRLASAASRR